MIGGAGGGYCVTSIGGLNFYQERLSWALCVHWSNEAENHQKNPAKHAHRDPHVRPRDPVVLQAFFSQFSRVRFPRMLAYEARQSFIFIPFLRIETRECVCFAFWL